MKFYGPNGDPTLEPRLSVLEAKNVRTTRFVIISSPTTSGSVTLPIGATPVLDDFGGTVDAVISGISGGRPTNTPVFDSGGTQVATTFDSSGNFVLSSTPASYPVTLIYRVSQPLVSFDSTASDIIGIPTVSSSSGGGGGGLSAIGKYSTLSNNTNASAVPVEAQEFVLGTPSFTPTGLLSQITKKITSYTQFLIQNTSPAVNASTAFVASNENATDTTNYVEMGINSSTYTGSGSLNLPNAGYLINSDGDLVIGTVTANRVRFLTNSSTTDAMSISSGGAVAIGSGTGILKTTSGVVGVATAGTDYQAALGYTPENITNKGTSFATINNTIYPTTQAVEDRIDLNDQFYFGKGIDGDATITSITSIVRDMFYNNLTISGAGSLNASGFRIYVAGTFTVTGTVSTGRIQRNGNGGANASGQTQGGAAGGLGTTSLAGSTGAQGGGIGGSGATPGSAAATNTGNTLNLGGDPSSGGNGGAGSTSAGGTSAAASLVSSTALVINNRFNDFFYRGSAYVLGGVGGQGGSGGGGGAGVGGGGGGGGGGGAIVWLAAKNIDVSGATGGPILSARGGTAGNGATISANGGGGGGGGSGGGGGYVFVAYKTVTGTIANFIDVSGGAGGSGGGGATGAFGAEGGGAGGGGAATIVNVKTGVVTSLLRSAAVAKVPASGGTAGVSGATATAQQLGI